MNRYGNRFFPGDIISSDSMFDIIINIFMICQINVKENIKLDKQLVKEKINECV